MAVSAGEQGGGGWGADPPPAGRRAPAVLPRLRRAVTVIPQDAALFAGPCAPPPSRVPRPQGRRRRLRHLATVNIHLSSDQPLTFVTVTIADLSSSDWLVFAG